VTFEARCEQQVLIVDNVLMKNGGTLLNMINSIATGNPAYDASVRVGYQILESIGYFEK
jgi:filamentous hemagglutinin